VERALPGTENLIARYKHYDEKPRQEHTPSMSRSSTPNPAPHHDKPRWMTSNFNISSQSRPTPPAGSSSLFKQIHRKAAVGPQLMFTPLPTPPPPVFEPDTHSHGDYDMDYGLGGTDGSEIPGSDHDDDATSQQDDEAYAFNREYYEAMGSEALKWGQGGSPKKLAREMEREKAEMKEKEKAEKKRKAKETKKEKERKKKEKKSAKGKEVALPDYEAQRQANIARNNAMLHDLGLDTSIFPKRPEPRPRAKKQPNPTPTEPVARRRSGRHTEVPSTTDAKANEPSTADTKDDEPSQSSDSSDKEERSDWPTWLTASIGYLESIKSPSGSSWPQLVLLLATLDEMWGFPRGLVSRCVCLLT
jgi:sRNA-binding protein